MTIIITIYGYQILTACSFTQVFQINLLFLRLREDRYVNYRLHNLLRIEMKPSLVFLLGTHQLINIYWLILTANYFFPLKKTIISIWVDNTGLKIMPKVCHLLVMSRKFRN